jgi:hypothetical protein
MREVQHGSAVKSPLPPLLGAHDILELLPVGVRTEVSVKWIRKNIPGKRRVGRSYVWPSAKVLEYLNSGQLGTDPAPTDVA